MKKTELAAIRNENEAARLKLDTRQIELAMQAQAPLLEGWGDLVNKPRGFDDQSSPFTPDSQIYDRQDGKFLPVYETEQDLARIRGQARNLITLTSVRTGALDALTNYVLGSGFTFRAASPDGAKTSPEILGTVQKVIDQLIDDNDFIGDMDREIHQRSREDGEGAIELEPRAGGRVKLSLIEPDQITEPRSTGGLEDWLECNYESCWKFGVHTKKGLTAEPIGYHVVYDGVGSDWDYIPAHRMQFIKRNVTRNAKRGISDFYEIIPELVREAKLCQNMVIGAALQAAVAWVLKAPAGTTQAQISALANTSTTALYGYQKPNASGSTTTQYVKKYDGGTILHTNGTEYADLPGHERNAGFEIVGQYALRRIGVRWNMPESLISGDASNANYASSLVAEAPFVKAREADQAFYKRHFLGIVWKALRIAWEAGRFNRFDLTFEQLEELVDVTCEAPEVATRDGLKLTQEVQAQMDLGLMSPQTASSKLNLDRDKEVQQGAKVKEAVAPFGVPSQEAPTTPPEVPNPTLAAAIEAHLESVTSTPEAKAILREVYP